MTDFINALTSFLKLFTAKPFHSLIAIAVLLALYLAIVSNAKVDGLAPPSPQQEKVMLQRSVVADQQINAALEDLRLDADADRVIIRQFTNNTRNVAGVPWAYIVTTHVAIRAGVSPPSFDRYPLAGMNHMLQKMWVDFREPKCIVETKEYMGTDPAYIDYMAKHGVVKFVSCPILSLQGYPIGIIGIGWINDKGGDERDEELMLKTKTVAERVGGYLDEIHPVEQKPWWMVW